MLLHSSIFQVGFKVSEIIKINKCILSCPFHMAGYLSCAVNAEGRNHRRETNVKVNTVMSLYDRQQLTT